MKKTLSILLSVIMAFSAFSVMPFSTFAADSGYYIVGSMTDWGINADYKLEADTSAEGEQYVFRNLLLTTTSELKVIYTPDGTNIYTWFPDGMGNSYGDNGEITSDGNYDVYFRPEGDSDGWFYNFIKVEPSTPAVETYNLYIGGTQITSANASDIFGDGKASFNKDTNTLTLTNATITGSYEYKPWYEAAIYSELPELTIKLNGSNTITPSNSYADGIDAAGGCNVNIVGDGSLSINNAYYGTYIGDWETAGGNLTVKDGATVTVTDSSAAGIWVNHDINITDSTVNITRTGTSYNGMVSNTGGTVTVTNSNVSITNPQAALHFGNGDDTAHKLVINSGTVTLSSNEALGIKCEPDSTSGVINGAIEINGGTLDITSAAGGTNITNITVAADLGYSIGNALSESGHIVIEKHIHSYTAKVTAPTCTEKGYTTHTCSCGDSYVDTYVDALGHDFGDNEKVCKRCGTANPDYKEPAPEPEAPVLSPEDAALPTVEKTDEEVKKTNTDKNDVVGATYLPLQLKATNKKNNVTLKWKAVKGAEGYIIYGSRCGTKMEKLATVTNAKATSYAFKKLVKGKYYKYIVAAYKTTADGERVITKSKSVHVATDGGKRGNPTGLTVNKSKLTLKKGKKATLKAKLKSKKGVMTHIAKFRYESSNTSVATVDKNGKVKATGKGSATIYVYTQNGIVKTVKVKVK